MKIIARCILLAFSIGILSTITYADGKFYVKENIPADLPYQRAFLVFHENTETMILQSKFEIPKSQPIDSLGWVVPIPSVPEITSVDADMADSYLFYNAVISTQPKFFVISNLLGSIVLIIFICSFPLSISLQLFIIPAINKTRTVSNKLVIISKISFYTSLICIFLLIFVIGIFDPVRQGAGGDVEIIKAEKAGIYDVKVIKSDSTEAIIEWLNENDFEFNENDSEVFADYINRDWCFVVAKVQPEPGTQKSKISHRGLAAPLVLKFETKKAIYPTALTASIGTETQILIYTLSENKLDCKNRLKFETAQKTNPFRFNRFFIMAKEMEEDKVQLLIDTFDNLPEDLIICKFKETLNSEQMKEDIVFEKASDNKPYQKTKILWKR